MSYATKTDLLDRITERDLVQLTDDEGAGVVHDGRIADALNDAAGIIDSYAANVYSIPLASTDRVRRLAVDLTVYYLSSRKPPILENVRKNFEDSVSFLKDVAAGKAQLSGQSDGTATDQSASASGDPVADDRTYFSDDENIADF